MVRQLFTGAAIASLVLVSTCWVSDRVQAQVQQSYRTPDVSFETPAGFSKLQALGRGTMGVVYPASGSEDNARFAIRLAVLEGSSIYSNMDSQELMYFLKHSFLGINAPAQAYQQRRFLGKMRRGEVQMYRTNRGVVASEIYMVPLSVGRQLMIAFEADTQLPLIQVETVINTVAATLQEVPQDEDD